MKEVSMLNPFSPNPPDVLLRLPDQLDRLASQSPPL